MSFLRSKMKELENIENRLKQINKERNQLHKQRKDIKDEIKEELERQGLPGFKMNGMAIILQEKDIVRKGQNKEDKIRKAQEVLAKYGIDDPERILDKVLNVMKGERESTFKLKLEKLK